VLGGVRGVLREALFGTPLLLLCRVLSPLSPPSPGLLLLLLLLLPPPLPLPLLALSGNPLLLLPLPLAATRELLAWAPVPPPLLLPALLPWQTSCPCPVRSWGLGLLSRGAKTEDSERSRAPPGGVFPALSRATLPKDSPGCALGPSPVSCPRLPRARSRAAAPSLPACACPAPGVPGGVPLHPPAGTKPGSAAPCRGGALPPAPGPGAEGSAGRESLRAL